MTLRPGETVQAYLDRLRVEDAAQEAAHRIRIREIEARGPRVSHGKGISAATAWPCESRCGAPVTTSDWAVSDGTGRVWHAECWHAYEAPGQGDLLEVLAVIR